MATADEQTEILGVYEHHPVGFAIDCLGADLWRTQRRILASLRHPRARVAVRACHASGKTHLAAQAVLWWTTTGGVTVTTAPTWTQVEKLLWGEVHRAYRDARWGLGGTMLQTQYKVSEDAYALGLSTTEESRFQGFHDERVLIIVDEGQGVRDAIYNGIEGIRAGGDVRVLYIGNPLVLGGAYHNAFTKDRAAWRTFRIDAFDTPNLADVAMPGDGVPVSDARPRSLLDLTDDELDANPRPYLVTRRWVREKWQEWGAGHPLWVSKVRGEFPAQVEDALVSLDWLEAARVREVETEDGDPVVAGVDVAGPGEDETALYVRRGALVLGCGGWHESDPRGAVVAALRPWKGKLAAVNVDAVGIGYNFALHLRDEGYPARLVNVGESAKKPKKYINKRAEVAWTLREHLKDGTIGGLVDEQTIGQLATIRYDHDSKGRVRIESKSDARKRGVASPDRAEALMLAFLPAGYGSTGQASESKRAERVRATLRNRYAR